MQHINGASRIVFELNLLLVRTHKIRSMALIAMISMLIITGITGFISYVTLSETHRLGMLSYIAPAIFTFCAWSLFCHVRNYYKLVGNEMAIKHVIKVLNREIEYADSRYMADSASSTGEI